METWSVVLICVVGAVIAVVVLVGRVSAAARARRIRERREELFGKYADWGLVDLIMAGRVWQGQTAEQLMDSLGRPADIDEKVYKTKTKEVWKYRQTGKNRFGLRVTVENGHVVGWDQKD